MAYTIFLDKERELKFTTRALYELETKLGEPVAGFMMNPAKMASVRILCTIVWAGQLHNNDPLTLDETIDNFEFKNFADAVQICGDALVVAMGGDPDSEPEPETADQKKSG